MAFEVRNCVSRKGFSGELLKTIKHGGWMKLQNELCMGKLEAAYGVDSINKGMGQQKSET